MKPLSIALLAAFLIVLLWPAIINPFQLDPASAWLIVCYVFAACTFAVCWRGVVRWQMTPFDYAVLVYLAVVIATWPASVDRAQTGVAVIRLLGQIAVYCALRILAADWPVLPQVIVATLIVGIAVLEWIALDVHLRSDLTSRLEDFPPLEWNGRAGLGTLAAVQFALLVGVGQRARDRASRIAAVVLIAAAVVEMVFLYARLPWVAAVAVLAAALIAAIPTGGLRQSVVIVAAVAVVILAVANPYLVHLIKTMFGFEYGTEAGLEIRLGLWRNAIRIIRDHAVAGVGLGNYLAVHQRLYPVPFPVIRPDVSGTTHPHNLFLQQAAELGIAGGLAYAALWGVALWLAWSAGTQVAGRSPIGAAAFYVLVALVVINMGENIFLDFDPAERVRLHTIGWMAIGVAVAQWKGLRAVRPRPVAAHAA